MKLLTFNYVDAKGAESDRTIMVVRDPGQHVEGLDLTEHSDDARADFVQEYNEALDAFNTMVEGLKMRHGVHKYRNFVPDRMTVNEIKYI